MRRLTEKNVIVLDAAAASSRRVRRSEAGIVVLEATAASSRLGPALSKPGLPCLMQWQRARGGSIDLRPASSSLRRRLCFRSRARRFGARAVVLETALSFSKLVLDAAAACSWRVRRFEAGAVVLETAASFSKPGSPCLMRRRGARSGSIDLRPASSSLRRRLCSRSRARRFEAGAVVLKTAASFSKPMPSCSMRRRGACGRSINLRPGSSSLRRRLCSRGWIRRFEGGRAFSKPGPLCLMQQRRACGGSVDSRPGLSFSRRRRRSQSRGRRA
jgi:hypothetical protein